MSSASSDVISFADVRRAQIIVARKEQPMKFLVTSKPRFQIPPEMIGPILDAFTAYVNQYTESGNIQESWSFAGVQGGGAILNVDSHEELDAIMTELPIAPFSEIEIYPLVDLHESLQRGRQVVQARMEAMAQMGAG
jgi:muconolactone delta-isomerase